MACELQKQKCMSQKEFLNRVWDFIPSDWKDFIKSRGLTDVLNDQLQEQYFISKPQAGGQWSAEPALQQMFAWTACPASEIGAIFIDMKPLRSKAYSYRSIGCAFGVQRRPRLNPFPNILDVTTIGKFLRLVHEVTGVPWTTTVQRDMEVKFKNGFDPLRLSRANKFLFLQMQLAIGTTDEIPGNNDELYQWATEFGLPLLQQIGYCNEAADRPPIPVIQLFNRQWLEDSLPFMPGLKVFRPSFMDYSKGPKTVHISGFSDHMFRIYVREVADVEYHAHRSVFREVLRAIYDDPPLTFTDEEINSAQ